MCNSAVNSNQFKAFKMAILETDPLNIFKVGLNEHDLTPITWVEIPQHLTNLIVGIESTAKLWLEDTYLPIIQSIGADEAREEIREIEYIQR